MAASDRSSLLSRRLHYQNKPKMHKKWIIRQIVAGVLVKLTALRWCTNCSGYFDFNFVLFVCLFASKKLYRKWQWRELYVVRPGITKIAIQGDSSIASTAGWQVSGQLHDQEDLHTYHPPRVQPSSLPPSLSPSLPPSLSLSLSFSLFFWTLPKLLIR